ncbi:pentapeptide repeat-containing protein [Falsiroseomonas sp.]|uniref:pentapeptide repeat-containing protein n=1 Tax=Falsiroseomonas sp. TaxID=2870721 RepID=UPI003F71616A
MNVDRLLSTPQRRSWAATLALGVVLLLTQACAERAPPSPPTACHCHPNAALDLVRRAPAIFEGRILESRLADAPQYTIEVIVEPTDIWKGAVPDRAVLRTAGCLAFLFPPAVGESILAMPSNTDDHGIFWLTGCAAGGNARAFDSLRGPASERRRLDAAVQAAPGSLAPAFERARFRENWDPEGAATAYAALARAHPEWREAHLGLARSLLYASRPAEALTALQHAAVLTPHDAELEGWALQARYRMGDGEAFTRLRQFQGISATSLDLTGRDLDGANFIDAAIIRLDAGQANLQRATFRNAYVGDAIFQESDLRHADLSTLAARFIFLTGARLDGATLDRVTFARAQFSGASLRDARATDAQLTYADFTRANLTGIQLNGSMLQASRFVDADLRRADLRGANLHGADLRGADLRGANLSGADLTAARYDCRTRLPSGVDPTGQAMIMAPGACPPR